MRRGWGEPGPEQNGDSRPSAPRRRWWRRLGDEGEEELGEEEVDFHQCIVKEGMGRGVHGRGGVTPSGSRHGWKRLELFSFSNGVGRREEVKEEGGRKKRPRVEETINTWNGF